MFKKVKKSEVFYHQVEVCIAEQNSAVRCRHRNPCDEIRSIFFMLRKFHRIKSMKSMYFFLNFHYNLFEFTVPLIKIDCKITQKRQYKHFLNTFQQISKINYLEQNQNYLFMILCVQVQLQSTSLNINLIYFTSFLKLDIHSIFGFI